MVGAFLAFCGFWAGFFMASPAICVCALIIMYFGLFGSVSYSEEV